MKKNIVKVLGLSLAAIMAAGSLAGCGSDSGKEEGKDGKKSVTLTFGSHQSGLPTTGVVQDLAKELKKRQALKSTFRYLQMLSGEI